MDAGRQGPVSGFSQGRRGSSGGHFDGRGGAGSGRAATGITTAGREVVGARQEGATTAADSRTSCTLPISSGPPGTCITVCLCLRMTGDTI